MDFDPRPFEEAAAKAKPLMQELKKSLTPEELSGVMKFLNLWSSWKNSAGHKRLWQLAAETFGVKR